MARAVHTTVRIPTIGLIVAVYSMSCFVVTASAVLKRVSHACRGTCCRCRHDRPEAGFGPRRFAAVRQSGASKVK
jgi:hypothetical protein